MVISSIGEGIGRLWLERPSGFSVEVPTARQDAPEVMRGAMGKGGIALAVVQVAPERKGGDEGRGRGRWASRSRVDLRKPERPAELPERPLPWPLLALSLLSGATSTFVPPHALGTARPAGSTSAALVWP